MKKLVYLAALLVADPRAVHAGSSCGGGGGSSGGGSSGGGSSGGGGGGSSSSSSSDSGGGGGESVSTACIDDTDVHGYRHCTKFGAWGKNLRIPRLFIELGGGVRNFENRLGAQTGNIQHGSEHFSYRVVMPTGGGGSLTDTAVTTTLRLGFGIGRGLYSGLELEAGGIVSPAAASAEMTSTGTFGSPSVSQGNGLFLGVTGVGGFRASGSRGSLALEGAAGLRSVHYTFESSYHLCETSTTMSVNAGVVEARARGELWLSPWITAGATVGASVLDRGDWMAGVYLGVHSRAFAGSR